jgi:glycosyltransferase involved in cell wall biosynthesis
MTIHFFTKGDINTASSRQRAFLVAEELKKRGLETKVHQPPLILCSQTPWPKKIKLIWQYLQIFLKDIKKEDLIYLQRTVYNKHFFILITLHKILFRRKMIFDFDDAIYLNSPLERSFLKTFKTKILTKLADAVVVGSHGLEDWAKKHNQKVFLIPTSIRFEDYLKFTKDYPENPFKINIGWIGNAVHHYQNLKILTPIFKRLIQEGMAIKFTLIGALQNQKVYSLFKDIKDLEVEIIDQISSSEVPAWIQKFDIGLLPYAEDSEWNRGKCSFKAVEYMACGVPVVCSAVGENNYLIENGKNGFLAKSEDEWVEKLKKLILDKNLREKLGKEGQKTIKEKYSYEANIPKLIEIFQKL